MRIWSLHPRYLDSKGLVALWRETLLAQNVLAGKTKGYQNHPQLNRFKASPDPLSGINQYLAEVYAESQQRGYRFNKDKIDWDFTPVQYHVTNAQMAYERQHLLNKLAIRDPEKQQFLQSVPYPDPHPMFSVINGDVEAWEVI